MGKRARPDSAGFGARAEDRLDGAGEGLEAERLGEEAGLGEIRADARDLLVREARHEQDAYRRELGLDDLAELPTVETRHDDVGQHQLDRALPCAQDAES